MSGAAARDEGEPAPSERRRYDSPLRRQRAAETRARILAAGAELARSLSSWDWNDLTFAAVADRAGVGERTVYRYFPTERQLHDAVMQRLEDEAGVTYEGIGLHDVADVADRVYASLGAFAVAQQPHGELDPSVRAEDDRRGRALRAAVDRAAGEWTVAQRERAAAALDVLWSIDAYERLVTQWDFDPPDAMRVLRWLIELVVDAIERDDGPAVGGGSSRQAKRAPNREV